MAEQLSDIDFIQRIEDQVHVGSNMYRREDVVRLFLLAGSSPPAHMQDLSMPYYRLPADYIKPLLRDAKRVFEVRDLAKNTGCEVISHRRHLVAITSTPKKKVVD